MGIVNVTPDSFSDGGRYLEPEAALQHALRLIEEGAHIIDIGGESTRPGATPVPEAEEIRRVQPVIEALARETKVSISIDTQKPAVARAALQAGASIVNDIGAHRADDTMWRVVADTGAGYVAMHLQGTPQTMQNQPAYRDVIAEVDAFFANRLAKLAACGVRPEQVALDVGIGFGKTVEHNLELLRHLNAFTKHGRPLLLGVSRKSFLGRAAGGVEVQERLPSALACACWAVEQGVAIIRTHDVAPTVRAVRMTERLMAATQPT